jgi:2-iminobutanoate/2-iminopropanoate deaminase
MIKVIMVVAGTLVLAPGLAMGQQVSPNGVKTLSPAGAIRPTGTWNLATRAGDFIFVAGMRGIDPKTDTLVFGDEARIRQAFLNMKLIAESEGASLRDAVRLVVFVTDMFRFRPIVNKVQNELWGPGASSSHHHRGASTQSGRHRGSRGNLLRAHREEPQRVAFSPSESGSRWRAGSSVRIPVRAVRATAFEQPSYLPRRKGGNSVVNIQ